MICRNCGAPAEEKAQFCVRCGQSLSAEGPAQSSTPPAWTSEASPSEKAGTAPPPPVYTAQSGAALPKQKLVCALLGIFLGWLGVHRFYLGYNVIGAIQLAMGLGGMLTCGITTVAAAIWGIVDGVMILTGSLATDAQEFRFAISAVCAALLVVFALTPEHVWLTVPSMCLSRNLLGLECPGCGMTRALASLAHGHVRAALDFNGGVLALATGLALGCLQVLRR